MVKLLDCTTELVQTRNNERRPIAFVPTMGNLHAGHISLLEKALTEFEVVYFSIFVNPKQFGPNEDFARYPRTLEQDLKLIEDVARKFPKAEVIVYAPKDTREVYPPGEEQSVTVLGITTMLEGAKRPGHFDGVTTVVHRLFELIKPKRAYFGLKDYQQYVVVKQMVKDLYMPIEIIGMPTIREASGLALSSRNQYLSAPEREEALTLSRGLQDVAKFLGGKKININKARARAEELKKDPRWNYLEIRSAEDLDHDLTNHSAAVLLGVFQLGTTRLLDSLVVEIE